MTESGWREGLLQDPKLHGAVALSVVLQALVVVTPIGNRLFETEPMTGGLWLVAIGLSLAGGLLVIAASALLPFLDEED